MSKEIFASNLRRCLERSGKTQKELAEAAGVSGPTVSAWCSGKKFPRMERVEWLADYFGVSKLALIEESALPAPEPSGPIRKEDITIGHVFKSLRMEKNLSVAECAIEIGISAEELRQYENGNKQMTAEMINMIANFFGLEPVDIADILLFSSGFEAKDQHRRNRHVINSNNWNKEFGLSEFTQEEVEELFQYGRFLLWKRGH